MKIPEFLDDLNIISKLGDNPGADNGLTAEGLKAKFDEGALTIQQYLNGVLIATLNQIFAAGGQLNEGLIMTGPINMNQQMLFGLKKPVNESEPVSLGFAIANYAPKSHVDDTNNPHKTTAAQVGAAPSGYGLGDSAVKYEDLNDATNCGWWIIESSTLNRPFGYGMGMTIKRYSNRFVQIAFNPHMSGSGEICVRSYNGTEWLPWEYINPPMYLNTEYRTTDRWGGKPVYVKRISFGALPASGSSNVPTGISGGTLVSLTGTFYLSGGGAEAYPVMDGSGPKCLAWVGAGCSYLYTQAIKDCSAHTGEFVIKYTKD